jgi:hypothetical protein
MQRHQTVLGLTPSGKLFRESKKHVRNFTHETLLFEQSVHSKHQIAGAGYRCFPLSNPAVHHQLKFSNPLASPFNG